MSELKPCHVQKIWPLPEDIDYKCNSCPNRRADQPHMCADGEAVEHAIAILDGNAEPIDWRSGGHELLRKLCEHLEAVENQAEDMEDQIQQAVNDALERAAVKIYVARKSGIQLDDHWGRGHWQGMTDAAAIVRGCKNG